MAKLTDQQRKQIIAEYALGGTSHRALAAKYGVSPTAIKKVLEDPESVQKCADKKKENEQSMLDFLNDKKDQAQDLIAKLLSSAVKDVSTAPLRDKMGAIKILTDVFGGKQEKKAEQAVSEHLSLMRSAFEAQARENTEDDNGDE